MRVDDIAELLIECVATWKDGEEAFFVARILDSDDSTHRSRDVRYRCYVRLQHRLRRGVLTGGTGGELAITLKLNFSSWENSWLIGKFFS